MTRNEMLKELDTYAERIVRQRGGEEMLDSFVDYLHEWNAKNPSERIRFNELWDEEGEELIGFGFDGNRYYF